MRQDRHGLHPELQPLVEVLAVQHPAPDVVGHTRDVGLVEAVVPAVAVSASFSVLFVTLIIRLLARWAPKKPALVGKAELCPADTLLAKEVTTTSDSDVYVAQSDPDSAPPLDLTKEQLKKEGKKIKQEIKKGII